MSKPEEIFARFSADGSIYRTFLKKPVNFIAIRFINADKVEKFEREMYEAAGEDEDLIRDMCAAMMYVQQRLKVDNEYRTDGAQITLPRLDAVIDRANKRLKEDIDKSKGYFKEGDINKFFGCAPGLTNGLTAREYIEKIRDERD